VLALLALLFGPAAIVTATGKPLSVECDGLDPTECDQAWRAVAAEQEQEGASGPVVTVSIEGGRPGSTCGTFAINRWWFIDFGGEVAIRDC